MLYCAAQISYVELLIVKRKGVIYPACMSLLASKADMHPGKRCGRLLESGPKKMHLLKPDVESALIQKTTNRPSE